MIDISVDRDLPISYKSPEKKPVSRVSRGHHGVLSFSKYIEKDEETKAFFFFFLSRAKTGMLGNGPLVKAPKGDLYLVGGASGRNAHRSISVERRHPIAFAGLKARGSPIHIFFLFRKE